MKRLLALVCALGSLLVAPNAGADPVFGLSFAIARERGSRVVDDAWIEGQIEDANHFFGPLGVRFRWTLEKELLEPHGDVHSRADRNSLTALMEPNVIDVFLVRELEDVDERGRYRKGVCWTGVAGRRFIILSRSAPRTVLAHELGHFFGNHQHSDVVNNLMSYSRDGGTVFLDDRQIATIRTFRDRFLETGRLFDVGPPLRRF